MLPDKITSEEYDALTDILSSSNYPILLKLLVKLVEEQERGILALTSGDSESTQKLTLAKGRQLCAKDLKASLLKFKEYCRKQYRV